MNDGVVIAIVFAAAIFVGLCAFTRLRIATVCMVTVGLAAAAVVSAFAFSHALHKKLEARHGHPHVFELPESPAHLDEDVAVEKARLALMLDGCGDCGPVPDGRSVAPDGRDDLYLVRNSANPNTGWITLTNAEGERIHVTVTLNSGELTCRRIRLK